MSNIPGYGRPGEQLRRDEQGRVRDARDRVVGEDGSRFYPRDYVWSPQPQPPRPTRNSEPSLWEQAIQLWQDLVLGFGHPVDLVRWVFIRALEHRALGYWLRNLEDVVRRAIRAGARDVDVSLLNLRPPRPRQPLPPPASAEDMPRFRPTCRHDPLTWKVSFPMSLPESRDQRASTRPRKTPRPEPRASRCAIPYAHRIEALRRAIRYREAYVLRHARRLARREAAASLPPPANHLSESGRTDFREVKSGRGSLHAAGTPPRNAKHEEPG
ncbi:MAG TPA: hypothetical protein VGO52_19335 [Hyphomonadaceae bacterium]|nr:hypothetical protein [Hyphomonadaceae bacterium]